MAFPFSYAVSLLGLMEKDVEHDCRWGWGEAASRAMAASDILSCVRNCRPFLRRGDGGEEVSTCARQLVMGVCVTFSNTPGPDCFHTGLAADSNGHAGKELS